MSRDTAPSATADSSSVRLRTVPRLSLRSRLCAAAATLIGAGAIAGVIPASDWEVRILLVTFDFAAPLIAIAAALPGIETALAAVVGLAGGLAVNVLVAQTMLATSSWSLRGGVVAVGAVAALVWLAPAGRLRT